MAVIVTVTSPGVTVTATPSSSVSTSAVSAGAIAGIVIGTLIGGALLIALILYLLNRYNRHKFTRVANPTHDPVAVAGNAPDLRYVPRTSKHLKRPSASSEPLISPVSWPPLPPTLSRTQSPGTPRSIAPKTAFPLAAVDVPLPEPEQTSPRLELSDVPPGIQQPSGDSPSTSPQNLFIYRMLQSRAKASEGTSPSRHPSLDVSQSRSTTPHVRVDEERLLADAERTALRDAEMSQRDGERMMSRREDSDGSTESSYSQVSAPVDHSGYFSESVNTLSLARRKSSRRQRTPALPTELAPVAEVSDVASSLQGRSQSRPISTAANSSLDDAQVSHGTTSRRMSSVLDPSIPLPLLTSVNFGKDSTTSGTPPGSISSTTGWASSSNGRSSRYPSLAPSSLSTGQSSRSGPRSDGGTDWHHTPSGLAGLATLQIGPLTNPHSPVEGQPEQEVLPAPAPAPADPVQTKRARLREGTTSSIPEVERRTVVQGGIARIDVTL